MLLSNSLSPLVIWCHSLWLLQVLLIKYRLCTNIFQEHAQLCTEIVQVAIKILTLGVEVCRDLSNLVKVLAVCDLF